MSNSTQPRTCRLALEDGTVFAGHPFGLCSAGASAGGEVVFNTAMCGYQEAITDPSYTGQILTMTAPEMGNYGVADEDVESAAAAVRGFVVREAIEEPSNHRAASGLSAWLAKSGVIGITGIDTRALVRILRIKGALRGVLFVGDSKTDAELVAMVRSTAAGSPGPFEMKRPSGRRARISAALRSCGTTSMSQPRSARLR